MTTISVRFYAELNDFLHPCRHQTRFTLSYPEQVSISGLITLLGIPNTDVELIVVNGESVDFSYVVQTRDRISVYPTFRSINISPIKKLRALN